MRRHFPLPAGLPPPGLPGLDPSWSRLVDAPSSDGGAHGWHVLDSGSPVGEALGTLLCVHGNPTWSYLWRRLVAEPPPGWRVVAPDQLGMGYSERLGEPRTYAQRVADLGDLTSALGIDGPVVVVAHDWGGPISLGWAEQHLDQLNGLILTNTAVHQPADSAAPSLIRLARTPVLRDNVCVRTPVFVRGTTAVSWPPLSREVRDAFAAPYDRAATRVAVGDFVADIPLEPSHPSMAALEDVRDGLAKLDGVPALALWGPRDPVFTDHHLRDLIERLPQLAVHRFEGASHLVTEDRPQAFDAIRRWVADLPRRPHDHEGSGGLEPSSTLMINGSGRPLWAALADRAEDHSTAIVELGATPRGVSFAVLAARVRDLAAGLAALGVQRGDRVALLVPPGADLAAAVYACWQAGAVIVVADAGLGLGPMGRALRGAGPAYVIGVGRGLAAAAALRVPGQRILAGSTSQTTRRAVGAVRTLDDVAALGRHCSTPAPPSDRDECAVLFTSGATGPAKGVVYRHGQAKAQLEAVRSTYDIGAGDSLVAAFAPFALYGPLLGIRSVVPDVDVTAPASLTAAKLADAAGAVAATLVFASPGALRNVVATVDELTLDQREALRGVRLVLSAGAPVPVGLLRAVRHVLPNASIHTPYGMTEALPITDIDLTEIERVGPGNGVCVGRPVAGTTVGISPLAADGTAEAPPGPVTDVTGEVCVRAPHVKDRYDRLWATQRASARDAGWHRTGDVGHLDADGRLWVEGRLGHVIVTADGVRTPVGIEQRVEALRAVDAAAVVGVGPRGTQQTVAVVVPTGGGPGGPIAHHDVATAVRAAAECDLAAVLTLEALPVDIRHQSKVNRAAVAAWAERVLAGGRARTRP